MTDEAAEVWLARRDAQRQAEADWRAGPGPQLAAVHMTPPRWVNLGDGQRKFLPPIPWTVWRQKFAR